MPNDNEKPPAEDESTGKAYEHLIDSLYMPAPQEPPVQPSEEKEEKPG